MIWVLISGWLLVALAAAAVFHVARSRYRPFAIPPEAQQFLRQLETQIVDNHPEFEIRGMVAGRFTLVLGLQGQELPASLHHLYRRFIAFPESFGTSVSRFLDELRHGGTDGVSDYTLAEASAQVLPQVRSREWLTEQGGQFGDSALVYRPLADDLLVCYVIDEPWSMTFVSQAHLRHWGVGDEEVHNLAVTNLRRDAGGEIPMPVGDGEAVMLSTGDGYDAARVLLLDPEQVEGLLVAVPERDMLWVGDRACASGGISSLMQMNEQQARDSAHPISASLYQVSAGELVRVTDPASE